MLRASITSSKINQLNKILANTNFNYKIVNHEVNEHKLIIKSQKNSETLSNLSSLLKCFELGKSEGSDNPAKRLYKHSHDWAIMFRFR